MENTALKMREIATAYHDAEEAKLRESAEGLVNSFLLEEIKSHANAGDYSMTRHVPIQLRPHVETILTKMGFVVETTHTNLRILW